MRIHRKHVEFCREWQHHPALKRVESIGTILAVEYQMPEDCSYFHSFGDCLKQFFLQQKVLVRPIGNVLHLMPPYRISEIDLNYLYQLIIHTLETPLWPLKPLHPPCTLFTNLIADHPLHCRWLNTLSYWETAVQGCWRSANIQVRLRKKMLKHAAEEFRHAF